MNFSFYLIKALRFFLFPFSILYGLVVVVRNFLFDKNLIRSVSFDVPIINVGNLSAGGTGKSPMVEYIISLLKDRYKVATLSRGYKRKTKGFVLAGASTTASDIGDESMQFYSKFPDIAVAVGEDRILAVPKLLQERPETNVIILDDAFQHRSIRPGFNILLTDYASLFTEDFFLPTGNLRDQRSSSKRANVIVVTKCPHDLTQEESERIKKEIRPFFYQKVYFTATAYSHPYNVISLAEKRLTSDEEVLLVTGIANPVPLQQYVSDTVGKHISLVFSDHHEFTITDIETIRRKFSAIAGEKKLLLTTEKDAVRLLKFSDKLKDIPVYAIPVKHRFLFDKGIQFDEIVNIFIKCFAADTK